MMKYLLLLTILLTSIWGCTSNPPATTAPEVGEPKSRSIEEIALDSLFARLKRHNKDEVKLTKEKDRIHVGEGTLSLKVKVQFEGEDQGQYVYAPDFETTYTQGKSHKLVFGVIGLGVDKKEAIQVALEDWSFQFGVALANLLVDTGTATTFNSWPLYDCPLGIRGEFPGNVGIFADSNAYIKIMAAVQPFFPKGKNQIISVDIRFANSEANGLDGGCVINNEMSLEAAEKLQQLDWPESDSGYIAKYYFLLDAREGK